MTRLMQIPAWTADADYVELFQQLARMHALIAEQGPRPQLLLKRAWLELAIGDYPTAQTTAAKVMDAGVEIVEAEFLQAEAMLRHALVVAGVGWWTPAHELPITLPSRDAFVRARDAFVALSDRDEQASRRVTMLGKLLDQVTDDVCDTVAAADIEIDAV